MSTTPHSKFPGSNNYPFASLEWLLLHHHAKAAQRAEFINTLNLQPGMSILDVACGPGLWTELLWKAVQPAGTVTGFDINQELIQYAGDRQSAKLWPTSGLMFEAGDYNTPPSTLKKYDVVFFSNSLCTEPSITSILDTVKKWIKPKGRLITSHFDNTVFLLNPMDPCLLTRVLAARAITNVARSVNSHYDDGVGRKLHGALLACKFETIETRTWMNSWAGPAPTEAVDYLLHTLESIIQEAAPNISQSDQAQWLNCIDPSSKSYILKSSEFFISLFNIVSICEN